MKKFLEAEVEVTLLSALEDIMLPSVGGAGDNTDELDNGGIGEGWDEG